MLLRRSSILAPAVALALFGAGCNWPWAKSNPQSTPESVAADAGKKACELFSADIATTELGGTPDAPKIVDNTVGGSSVGTCTYSYKGTGNILSSTLLIRTAPNANQAKQIFDQAQAQASSTLHVAPEPVTGFGDGAYWVSGQLNELNVLKGNQWLILSMHETHAADDRTAVTAAMKSILGKL